MNQTLYRCYFINDCLASRRAGHRLERKKFFKDQVVVVAPYSPNKYGQFGHSHYITQDGYMMPKVAMSVLEVIPPRMPETSNFDYMQMDDEIQDAVEVKDSPRKFIPKMSIEKNFGEKLTTKSKSAINGGLIGLASGLIFAMATGKNKIMFSVIGSVAGVVLGNMYNKHFKDK